MISALVGGSGLKILLEPGRFLVGNAGVLLTRVLYRKRSGGKEFIITDAGMTDLLRPSSLDNAAHIARHRNPWSPRQQDGADLADGPDTGTARPHPD